MEAKYPSYVIIFIYSLIFLEYYTIHKAFLNEFKRCIKTFVYIKLIKNMSHNIKLSFSNTVKCKELFDLNDNYTNGGQGRCTRIIAGNQLFH